jgi:predicted enzyme related to lactoylglutathione lyase
MRITCVTFDAAEPERVAAFWAAALGWESTVLGDGAVCARSGVADLYLEFVPVPEGKEVKNRVHLGTEVDDLDAEIARLTALGATCAWEEDLDDPGFRNAVMRDPEGNEFCIGARTT